MITYALMLPKEGRQPERRQPINKPATPVTFDQHPRNVSQVEHPTASRVRPPPIPPPVERSTTARIKRPPLFENRPPTPQEVFISDPVAGFDSQFARVDQLLKSFAEQFAKIDESFAYRMLKNTSADVQNHLLAKTIIEALETKRSQMQRYHGQADIDPRAAGELAFSKIAVVTSPIGSPHAEKTTLMDLNEIEREFDQLVKTFQRRKTFHDALVSCKPIGE